MTFITDKVPIKNGADYTFVCSRIPFAVSCSSSLPHGDQNLIDLDLVLKMKIPLQRIKVERINVMGDTVRTVGVISQTIQCVQHGRISGNIHLRAKVVRDLYSLYDVDCIASSKTYTRLVGRTPSKYPDDNMMDLDGDEDDHPVLDGKGDDNIVLDDDGDDNIVLDDDGEDNIEKEKQTRTRISTTRKDAYNDNCSKYNDVNEDDVTIGDIPWGLGYSDPSADENYQPDCIIRARPPPHSNTSGNKTVQHKTNFSTEADDELFCKLCFTTGQPLSTTTSHHSLHISCPSMTDEEKEQVYGPNWVAVMYGYPADPP